MSPVGAPARILIVDDSAVQRTKLSFAVRDLGHTPLEARDGREALAALETEPIDLVILDLVMPELDGFGVLRAMGADARLTEIPVLVVSALEEAEDVAEAIALGAADVLAKSFDPAILAARLDTSLERRRLRLAELDRLDGARRLTEAARLVEEGATDAEALGLGGVAGRQDSLGDLARVFTHMVVEVRLRQAAYERQILLLRGALLLAAMAVPLALLPSIARHLAAETLHPLGIIAYGVSGAAILLVLAALLSGHRISPVRPVRSLQAALVGTVLPVAAVMVAARDLEAGAIALLLAVQPALVFAIGLAAGRERPEPLRLLGCALAGVAVLLLAHPEASAAGGPQGRAIGIGAALLAAALLAAGTVLLGRPRPEKTEPGGVLGGAAWSMTLGALISLPVALASGVLPAPDTALESLPIATLSAILAVAAAGQTLAVRRMGPALASQHAIPLAVAGMIWAMLLLGERPNALLWLALPCLIAGLLLVKPAGPASRRDAPRGRTEGRPERVRVHAEAAPEDRP